jgi:metallo-beta-lactamase family protein
MDVWSAHADADEILAWLKAARGAPERVYLVHGEPNAADVLRQRIEEQLGWPVEVPEHLQSVQIDL